MTLICYWKASENGATGVELDLEFTADGVPILMHDDTVDRTTNGSGPLSKLLFSELRKLDAAAKHRFRLARKNDRLVSNIEYKWARPTWRQQVVCFCWLPSSDRFRGEKVPTLQEAVEECIKRQLTIYFDVKGHPDEVPSQLCMSTLLVELIDLMIPASGDQNGNAFMLLSVVHRQLHHWKNYFGSIQCSTTQVSSAHLSPKSSIG